MPTEPILTRTEIAEVLRDLHEELGEVIETYEEDETYDPADAAEAAASVVAKIGLALIPSGSALKSIAEMLGIQPVVDAVAGLVEAAQERSRTPARLRSRIERARQTRADALEKAADLERTPAREFREKARVNRLTRRAAELAEKIDRLEGLLASADAE